jgi:hypothetical protein
MYCSLSQPLLTTLSNAVHASGELDALQIEMHAYLNVGVSHSFHRLHNASPENLPSEFNDVMALRQRLFELKNNPNWKKV